MNISFWTAGASLLLLALAFVLLPLVRGRRRALSGVSEARSNLAVLRRRMAELRGELERGELDEAAHAEALAELERQVIEQTDQVSWAQRSGSFRGAVLLALLVPLIAVPVYLGLGNQQALEVEAELARIQQERESQVAFIRDNLSRLEQRLAQNPEDGEAWLMLGRSYAVVGRPADAAEAYARARERLGEQPALLRAEAEARGRVGGEAQLRQALALTDQALRLQPGDPQTLWLAGRLAVELGENPAAGVYWRALRDALPPNSTGRGEVDRLLAELGEEAATASEPVSLRVSVSADPALVKALPEDTVLFVYARGEQAGPPLAAVRRRLGDLPLTLALSDADAMLPGHSLATADVVRVEARLSPSGEATPRAGDPVARSAPLNPRTRQGTVELRIERRVSPD
ncbi:c-type cytochrome biogenesis protein CcmI [Alkalilimnicola sp. S0819]|uniref:c-type cytochrome biogenesis protein CcmI n=1 Tax=Alkalilimnicola sp. S0819 TaxID=2613922 RepID=UPI0012625659|nr:c-type cytochrome biogenesis protein CcmI [Alkalilimnicola sp. S0819]KAB7627492.1 c-type cytochrome biogenesis protein CcmI [Alkalilimnicola sp. S0819]MPQ15645.1 c-type cytochrome biogenesis protein CcmI [Alkalilimnicola sp. S0819]